MIKTLTGMKDLLAPEIEIWQRVELCARAHFELYHYQEIRTPVLEEAELFQKAIGSETGVVQKEMYAFEDKGGDLITLRPEGTASVIRSFIEHHLDKQDPISKLYYMGPMFRYERPQKGRLRQFHQIGCELIGSGAALSDVEMMLMLDGLFKKLKLTSYTLEINTLGCLSDNCRPVYLEKIASYFKDNVDQLCDDCGRKQTTNPLRIFDCKKENCRNIAKDAPDIFPFLCEGCAQHHGQVLTGLDGLGIAYQINARIVRGLDYYNRTAFEYTSDKLGSQDAFTGGGRYDGLIASQGGPDTPAVGFAIGFERLVMLLDQTELTSDLKKIYFAFFDEATQKKCFEIATQLRQQGIVCEMDYEKKSLKAQMRRANKLGFSHVAILGEDEMRAGKIQLKDLNAKTQQEVEIDHLSQVIGSSHG